MAAQPERTNRLRRLRKKTAVPSLKFTPTDPVTSRKAKGLKAAARTDVESSWKQGRFVLKEKHPDYTIIRDALSEEDLRRLNDFLRLQKPEPARMKNEGEGEDDHIRKIDYDDRDCQVFWFHLKDHCMWLQRRLADITKDVANSQWPLLKVKKATGAVNCEWEQSQYTVYSSGQHFNCWHQDAYADGHDQEDARQFAIVFMLTKRDEYADGDFEMKLPAPSGKKGMFLRRSRRLDAGDAIVFPAKRLIHRVRPVSKGVRRTLVTWVNDRMSCHFYNKKLRVAKRKTK